MTVSDHFGQEMPVCTSAVIHFILGTDVSNHFRLVGYGVRGRKERKLEECGN